MKRLSYILEEQNNQEFEELLRQIQGGTRPQQDCEFAELMQRLWKPSSIEKEEEPILGKLFVKK